MKTKIITLLISAVVLCTLSACSYVKNFFPDKEKDYQYTTEIPPLILPEDLKKGFLPDEIRSAPSTPPPSANVADAATPATAVNALTEEDKSAAPATNESPAPSIEPESEPVLPDTAITVDHIKLKDGENRLRLNVPFIKAWRMINKALSRKSIEVTARNQEAKLITVQYDPDEQKIEDGTYWDEVKFMVRGLQGNDKTYLLKLEENSQQTDISVLDEEQKILSDEAGVKLLTVLEETMKADLAKK
ncbi:MAG: outer membrane protein assembly factor BamC [Methylococcales bacterium]|nr:outer membrane protein assembly factor BamC [Methylococcales bacterium]MDD5631248.1 outer membrane protein assembly factor BamC [Methylococcales bacterium]